MFLRSRDTSTCTGVTLLSYSISQHHTSSHSEPWHLSAYTVTHRLEHAGMMLL